MTVDDLCCCLGVFDGRRCATAGLEGHGTQNYMRDVGRAVRILPNAMYEGFFLCKMQKLRARSS